MNKFAVAATMAAALMCGTAHATDLEVTHWWTSGGEAAAVKVFADALDATGTDHWVDGAIAGSGDAANPIIISRILGGNPMGATQMNTGRDAEQLIQAGLMQDLTSVAEAEHWKDVIRPAKLLDSCMFEGKMYCVPVNIHSQQWLWLSRPAFENNGMTVPTTWTEYVADFPKLKEAGIIPISIGQGWPINTMWGVLLASIGGPDLFRAVNIDKNADAVRGDDFKAVVQAFADVRDSADSSAIVPLWNDATQLVIEGKAAGNIMGDWAQGEFAVANQVAGKDYDCLPGLGMHNIVDTGGDAFYFPKSEDPEITRTQLELAKIMLSPEVQVAFNLKKGSMPVRGDVDLAAANACMKKGLEILADPANVLPTGDQTFSSDTQGQLQDLALSFFADKSMTAEDFQAQYADIVASAD
ncbi:MAG TPA: ABC transporter substrate-binding protein [Devosia sp.]|nr:ABC transporter substrate-binding protein [Devosia sp.]